MISANLVSRETVAGPHFNRTLLSALVSRFKSGLFEITTELTALRTEILFCLNLISMAESKRGEGH